MALSTFVKYWQLYNRMQKRSKRWATQYKRYLSGELTTPPYPSVIQAIVTEHCNLRCPMCNQWGEFGYFKEKARPVSQIDADKMIAFLEWYGTRTEYGLCLHGGEPMLHKNLDKLLNYVAEKKIDTLLTTNGTLIERHLDALANANPTLIYYLSCDGGPETHDRIRGKGTAAKLLKNTQLLRDTCLAKGVGAPKFMATCCVSEHNAHDFHTVLPFARKLGAQIMNFQLRDYLYEEHGRHYNDILANEFNIKSTNAWLGHLPGKSFDGINESLRWIFKQIRRQYYFPRPPFVGIFPDYLNGKNFASYFSDYANTFGITACLSPAYMFRVASNGDLIYCSNHMDFAPGNIFTDDFDTIHFGAMSEKYRKYVEKQLFPTCNRCCGLGTGLAVVKHIGQPFTATY